MNLLRKFLLWILYNLNKGEPSRAEIGLAWGLYSDGNDYYLTERIKCMMTDYIDGWDFEEIAIKNKCTRERVRQCLMKGTREALYKT